MANKALKAGAGYTLGNVLIKALNFIFLPVFSRIMSAEEFGVYNVFLSYESFLSIVIGLSLHTSLKNAKIEFDNEIDKYTSSISLLYLVDFCVLLLFSQCYGKQLVKLLGINKELLLLLVVCSFCSAIILLYNERVSLDYDYKKYIIVSALSSVTNILVSFVLIFTLFKYCKELGRIVGSAIPLIILTVVIIFNFYKKSSPAYNRNYWKFALLFSVPMVPHNLSQIIMGHFDRIMIQKICGYDSAGIYSLASNVRMIITVISSSIITSWSVWFFERMREKDVEKIKKEAAKVMILFGAFVAIMIMISPELIWLFGGQKYEDAKYIVVPMIMDAFLVFNYGIVVQGEYYMKKTSYVMIGTVLAAVVDIVLNAVFIPRYGFVAAAYTTLVAYLVYYIFHLWASHKFCGYFVIGVGKVVSGFSMMTVCGILCICGLSLPIFRYIICILIVLCVVVYLITGKRHCA